MEAVSQPRIKVHWSTISISKTWKEGTRPVTARPHLTWASQKQWCTLRRDKMTTGIRLLNIIENYTNLSKKRRSKRKWMTRLNSEDFWVIKCNLYKVNVTRNRKMTGSIWLTSLSNWELKRKHSRRRTTKRGNI